MASYHLLICDDEKEIRELLKLYLHGDEYRITEAANGREALEILRRETVDLLLLDIMMPELSGLDLMKAVRSDFHSPILILSARTSLSERLLAYDIGADDYITKPFEPLEVVAKVKARLRGKEESEEIQAGNLTLLLDSCKLEADGVRHDLSKTEFLVLKLFLSNPGRVFTKAQIYRAGWEDEYLCDDNSIHVLMSRLRAKVGEERIETIRNLGYRLRKE